MFMVAIHPAGILTDSSVIATKRARLFDTNPGSSFISMVKMLQKMMDEQQRQLRESFKVT